MRMRILYVMMLFGLSLCGLGLLACGAYGQACEEDDDCPWGYFCRNDRTCAEGCRYSIECPKGQLCQAHQCSEALKDDDKDGFPVPLDCDDGDGLINPAVQEVCGNKKDDNCDGRTDEPECISIECRPGSTRECYDGNEKTLSFPGTQCKKGTQTCNSTGSWGDCQGQILPSAEQCDSIDSDCDGAIDEGDDDKPLVRPCFTGTQDLRGKGACVEGNQACQDGKWLECVGDGQPQTESCNGIDDDCNGIVDDVKGLGEVCLTGLGGICKDGKRACDVAKKALVCKSNQAPVQEVCGDAIDNDCDGQIDNTCPFVASKVTDLGGFPHELAVGTKYLAVSLRDDKKVVLFDISTQSPKRKTEISIPEAPYGLRFVSGTFYVVTESKLYKLDVDKATATGLTLFSQTSHAAGIGDIGGRLLTRYAGKDLLGKDVFGACLTPTSGGRSSCAAFSDWTHISASLHQQGTYGLLISDKGVHFIDTLNMKEDSTQFVKLPGTYAYFAVDDKTQRTLAADPVQKQVAILNFSIGLTQPPLQVKDEKGLVRKPGHVIAADGVAFVGHRDGSEVSMFDMDKQKLARVIKVGLGPLGMAIGNVDAKGQRIVWVACPGDGSLWQFTVTP